MSATNIIRSQMVLDDKGFKKGADRVRRESKKLGDDFEKAAKKGESAFARLGKQIAKVVAVGAAVQQIRRVSQEMREIDRMARQLGITAEEIQSIGFIAEQNHSDANTFTNALTRMNRKLGETGPTGDRLRKALNDLGIEAREFTRLNMTDQLIELSRGFNEAGGSVQELGPLFALMEDDAKKVAVAFDNSEEALRKMADDGVRYSSTAIRQYNDDMDAVNAALRELDVVIASVTRTILTMVKALSEVDFVAAFGGGAARSFMGELSEDIERQEVAIRKWGDAILRVGDIIAGFAPEVDDGVKNMNKEFDESVKLVNKLSRETKELGKAMKNTVERQSFRPTFIDILNVQLAAMEQQLAELDQAMPQQFDTGRSAVEAALGAVSGGPQNFAPIVGESAADQAADQREQLRDELEAQTELLRQQVAQYDIDA